MGRDKALLVRRGVTFAESVRRALAAVCDEVYVSVRRGQASPLRHLREVRDAGTGPLGGIAAGLAGLGAEDWLAAVACDMPSVTAALVAYLLAAAQGHEAAVPVLDKVPQVACAVWSGKLAEPAAGMVAIGHGALRELLKTADFATVDATNYRIELKSFDSPADVSD